MPLSQTPTPNSHSRRANRPNPLRDSVCVPKCAPERRVREHRNADRIVCVPKCAELSFRRALRNGTQLVRFRSRRIPCLGTYDECRIGRCHSHPESQKALRWSM
ncbi:hypothetical protein BBNG_01750 [Bifidobacterium bifidum NCIMB 41171]|nr:hypothetical protein BBNG_01750 [Bifidobacterium bifidum NCIMB 41171]